MPLCALAIDQHGDAGPSVLAKAIASPEKGKQSSAIKTIFDNFHSVDYD